MNRCLWTIIIAGLLGGCSTPSSTTSGQVHYHKRIVHEDLSTTTVLHPVVGATVQLERIDKPTVLAETTTDDHGRYSFDTSALTEEALRVRVLAQAVGPRVNITVYSDVDAEALWSVTNEDNGSFNIEITEPYAAGAFNVVSLAKTMGDVLESLVPPDIPPPLAVHWDASSIPFCGSCFYVDKNLLEFTGEKGDEDAHDDSVVLHELAHYLEATWGSYDNPGGRHNRERVGPSLAWSEGFATWFQAAIRGVANYVDLRPQNAYVLNLQDPPADRMGVDGELPDALLSEALVYGVLWDLTDPANGDESPYTLEDVLQEVIGLTHEEDVGVVGADFLDFLSEWRCTHNSVADETILQALLETVGYPLDFDDKEFCPPARR